MKKLVLTATLTLACAAAFAQGKVNFKNDSLHLVYFTTDTTVFTGTLSGDAALAGQAIPSNGGTLSSGGTLVAELWAGTSVASMTRQFTTSISSGGTPGTWSPVSTTPMPTCPAGYNYFDVYVYDSTAGSYAAASTETFKYFGSSGVFQSTANSGTAYYSIVQTTSPGLSTWAVGTYALDNVLAGAKGAIMLTANVPEPTTMALAGLGAAALLIFRRRK